MSDLWSITVPGYTTGVATVALVAVTALIVSADRRREKQSAVRDARKVFGTTSERPMPGASDTDDKQQVLTVINVSADPIFQVGAFGATVESSAPNPRLYWSPALHQYVIPYVRPGQEENLIGQWCEGTRSHEGHENPRQLPYWAWPHLEVVVSWTDGRGLKWERAGSREPQQRKDR